MSQFVFSPIARGIRQANSFEERTLRESVLDQARNDNSGSGGTPPRINSASEIQLQNKFKKTRERLTQEALAATADKDVKKLSDILRNPLFKGMKIPVSENGQDAEIVRLLQEYKAKAGPLPESALQAIKDVLTGADKRNCVLSLSEATLSENIRSEGASSHEAVYVHAGQHDYRIKFNHHGPVSTFFELLSARLNKEIFAHPYAPEVKAASHTEALPALGFHPKGKYTRVGIASRMVEGFKDWGDFLVNELATDENGSLVKDENGRPKTKRAARALEHVDEKNKEAYARLLRDFESNRLDRDAKRLEIMQDFPETEKLLKKEKDGKTDYTKLPKELVAKLQPLRDLDRKALHIQDRMLKTLPREFNDALVLALAEAEVTCNWDYANHERANVGFVVRNGKLLGATCIDFGVAGHNAFSGKQMDDSESQGEVDAAIRRPARVDDPFLYVPSSPEEKEPLSEYLQRDLLDKDVTEFTHVAGTGGFVGSLPRSGAYAAIMKDRIWEERELDKKSDEMLRTAYRLSLLKRSDVEDIVGSVWNECAESDDPNLRDMIKAVEARGHSTKTLTDDWNSRFTAIVERAGPDLAKWALLNRM